MHFVKLEEIDFRIERRTKKSDIKVERIEAESAFQREGPIEAKDRD